MPSREQVLAAVRVVLEFRDEVLEAYLFGSIAAELMQALVREASTGDEPGSSRPRDDPPSSFGRSPGSRMAPSPHSGGC
jgi:hypothetical protein